MPVPPTLYTFTSRLYCLGGKKEGFDVRIFDMEALQMDIDKVYSSIEESLKKEEVAEYLNVIESYGIVLAGTLYDTEDRIFSEAVIYRDTGRVEHIFRGSPSITHRLLHALLQHPKLKFFVPKLKISPNFGVTEFDKNRRMLVCKEGERLHYGHTFSLIVCDIIGKRYNFWGSSFSSVTPASLDKLLEEWKNYLKDSQDSTKIIYNFLDYILRILSFHYCVEDEKEDKNIEEMKIIVKGHFQNVVGEFLNFTQNKDFWFENDILLDPYKIYIFAESLKQNIQIPLSKEDACKLYSEKISRYLTMDGVIHNDYEGTLALLCGLVVASEELLCDIFRRGSFIRHLENLDESKLYDIGYHTVSYRFNEGQVKLYEEKGGGRERVSYLPAAIPFYLLRLATLLREKYSLEDYKLPFSDEALEEAFLLRKEGGGGISE